MERIITLVSLVVSIVMIAAVGRLGLAGQPSVPDDPHVPASTFIAHEGVICLVKIEVLIQKSEGGHHYVQVAVHPSATTLHHLRQSGAQRYRIFGARTVEFECYSTEQEPEVSAEITGDNPHCLQYRDYHQRGRQYLTCYI